MPYLFCFLKKGRIFNCRLLQIIGGALRVKKKISPTDSLVLACSCRGPGVVHICLGVGGTLLDTVVGVCDTRCSQPANLSDNGSSVGSLILGFCGVFTFFFQVAILSDTGSAVGSLSVCSLSAVVIIELTGVIVTTCFTCSKDNHMLLSLVEYHVMFRLFGLILIVPSTIFHLNREGSSWVEPVLSKDKCVLLKDHNPATPVRLESAAPRSQVKHSTTEPLRSPIMY